MAHEDLRPSWGVATNRHGRMKSNYAPSACLSSEPKPRAKAALFVLQGHHRIDTTGPPGGNEAGKCADSREQGDRSDESQ